MNWVWGPTRYAIYVRDRDPDTGHFRCVWCGQRVWVYGEGGKRRVCLDHLHPVHLGGNGKQYNLVTSCHGCNNKRGGTHWEDHPIDDVVMARIRAGTCRPLTKDERAEGRKLWKNRTIRKKSLRSRHEHWSEKETVSPSEPSEVEPLEVPF